MTTVDRSDREDIRRYGSWLRDLVKSDALGRTTDDESEQLRSDQWIEPFYDELVLLAQQLHEQLTKANAKESLDVDEVWRRRTQHMWRRVNVRLVEVKPLVKEYRRRKNAAHKRHRATILAEAITFHREHTPAPTEADEALWRTLDELNTDGGPRRPDNDVADALRALLIAIDANEYVDVNDFGQELSPSIDVAGIATAVDNARAALRRGDI